MGDARGNGEITLLLRKARQGDEAAKEEFWQRLYTDLKRIGAAMLRRQPAGHTLTPTAVVNEAYVRLCKSGFAAATDREHFQAIAARVMRALLVDHARRKTADKRGGGWSRVTLDDHLAFRDSRAPEILDLHRSLNRLAEMDERLASVVELRYFGGLTMPEIAACVGSSLRTVNNDWTFARTWLERELKDARP